jgi:hypothetical protein
LRDYPRCELNDLDAGLLKASTIFVLDDGDKPALSNIDSAYIECESAYGDKLDNSRWHHSENAPQAPTYDDVMEDLFRLSGHVDTRWTPSPAVTACFDDAQ